jgi:hypothetical protein
MSMRYLRVETKRIFAMNIFGRVRLGSLKVDVEEQHRQNRNTKITTFIPEDS